MVAKKKPANADADQGAADIEEARQLLGLPTSVPIAGGNVVVTSYGWPQLFDVLQAAQPIVDAIAAEPHRPMLAVICEQKEATARLVQLSTGMTPEAIQKLSLVDSMKLGWAVWDENKAFFTQELRAILHKALGLKTAKSLSADKPISNPADTAPIQQAAGPASQID